MSSPVFQRTHNLKLDGIQTRGRFPLGHEWNLDIIVKGDPSSDDKRRHLMAVIFEGRCSCGGKLFYGVPQPRCWMAESTDDKDRALFMEECLLGIYNDHFNSEKPLIYA